MNITWKGTSIGLSRRDCRLKLVVRIFLHGGHEPHSGRIRRRVCEISEIKGYQITTKYELCD